MSPDRRRRLARRGWGRRVLPLRAAAARATRAFLARMFTFLSVLPEVGRSGGAGGRKGLRRLVSTTDTGGGYIRSGRQAAEVAISRSSCCAETPSLARPFSTATGTTTSMQYRWPGPDLGGRVSSRPIKPAADKVSGSSAPLRKAESEAGHLHQVHRTGRGGDGQRSCRYPPGHRRPRGPALERRPSRNAVDGRAAFGPA